MRKMCQSQQFVTWDADFCHMEDQSTFCCYYLDSLSHGILQASVTPAQTFAGKKLKTQRLSKMVFFTRTCARNLIYKSMIV